MEDEGKVFSQRWKFFHWKPVTESGLGFQVRHCSVQNSKQFFSRNLEDSHLQGSYFLILSAIANSLFYSLGVRVWSCFCGRTGDDVLTCLAFGLGGRSSVQQQTDKPLVSYCFFYVFVYSTTSFCIPKSLSFRPRLVFFQFRFWAPRGLAVQRQQALGSKLICFGEKNTDWLKIDPAHLWNLYIFLLVLCLLCLRMFTGIAQRDAAKKGFLVQNRLRFKNMLHHFDHFSGSQLGGSSSKGTCAPWQTMTTTMTARTAQSQRSLQILEAPALPKSDAQFYQRLIS